MWGRWRENALMQRPCAPDRNVRCVLRNRSVMEAQAGHFAWVECGDTTIEYFAYPVVPMNPIPRMQRVTEEVVLPPRRGERAFPVPEPLRGLDDIPLKKKAKPTEFERLSRCLPEGVIWGDPMPYETVQKIVNEYLNQW